MQRALLASVAFHVAVVTVAYVGVPVLRRDAPVVEAPIVIDVVTVAETTNAPPPKVVEEPKPAPEKKPPPPPPPPPSAETPPPKPEPPPAPEPAPKAEPAPAPKPEPEPVEQARPEPKPEPPPKLASVKPKRKPKAPSRFASVLKTVENLKDRPPPAAEPETDAEKEPPEADEPAESFEARIARSLGRQQRTDYDPTAPLTISEIDLVRRQIAKCWVLPAGAKDAEDLIIEIRVEMNIDGIPRVAEIVDRERLRADSFFRAAAEAALRAVLNRRCHPFRLPANKFDRWRTMTLVFNPKEMFGT